MTDTTDDTQVSEDTTVSEPTTEEVVETSTNEDSDVDLEDDETLFDDLDDDESEEDDSEAEPEAEETEESKEDVEQEPEEEPVEETEEVENTPSEEDLKKHNAEMAAKRIAEKQARDKAKEDQRQKYLAEAEDNRDLALRQLQVDAYNNRIERNANTLQNGIEKAVASIDLFKSGSPEVKEALASSLEKFERMYVQYDSNGDPTDVKGDVYEYLQNEADSIRRILNTGARQQSKAKEKAKTRTETIPSKAPKEPKIDPDLAAFDEEVAKWS